MRSRRLQASAVKFPDNKHTARAQGFEAAGEGRALHGRAGDTFVFEDRCAPGLLQRRQLEGGVLIVSTDARIAVLHAIIMRQTYATCKSLISRAENCVTGLTLGATRTVMFSGRLPQTHPEGLQKHRSTYWGVMCSRDLQSRLKEASAGLPKGHLMSTYLERIRSDMCCSTYLVKCARRSVVHAHGRSWTGPQWLQRGRTTSKVRRVWVVNGMTCGRSPRLHQDGHLERLRHDICAHSRKSVHSFMP
jgi:hypothetical protein